MDTFTKLVATCVRNNISDLHIRGGQPVVVRKNGQLFFQKDLSFSQADLESLVGRLLSERQRQVLASRWSVDFSAHLPEAQMRMNAFYTAEGLRLAVRFLPSVIPDFESLNLHPSLRELCGLRYGLILLCGPTGNGKTTTIAAMVGEINRTRPAHIVTLEDPIEYRFASERSLVDQRELGTHFLSFEQGLQDVLREDADVIVVGELREAETMRLTINAAESGHLVIATLHAGTAEEALLRLCNAFPLDAQDFVRSQLASCIGGVVVQHLEFMDKVGFQVPNLSIARASGSLKNIIRDNRFNQIENILHSGKADGMFTFERYREEFLDKKTAFVPPSKIFQAGKPTAPPPVAPAPLGNGLLTPPLSAPPAAAPGPLSPPPGQMAPPAQAVAEPQGLYHIGEEASLEELVEQMKKSAT